VGTETALSRYLNIAIGVSAIFVLSLLAITLHNPAEATQEAVVNETEAYQSPSTSDHVLMKIAVPEEVRQARRARMERVSEANNRYGKHEHAELQMWARIHERKARMAPIRQAQYKDPGGEAYVVRKPVDPLVDAPVLVWVHDDPELDSY